MRIAPLAEWALLHVEDGAAAIEFRRVPFDVDQLVGATPASGRPHAKEFAAEWRP